MRVIIWERAMGKPVYNFSELSRNRGPLLHVSQTPLIVLSDGLADQCALTSLLSQVVSGQLSGGLEGVPSSVSHPTIACTQRCGHGIG